MTDINLHPWVQTGKHANGISLRRAVAAMLQEWGITLTPVCVDDVLCYTPHTFTPRSARLGEEKSADIEVVKEGFTMLLEALNAQEQRIKALEAQLAKQAE